MQRDRPIDDAGEVKKISVNGSDNPAEKAGDHQDPQAPGALPGRRPYGAEAVGQTLNIVVSIEPVLPSEDRHYFRSASRLVLVINP
jgi:hypothetical protein